MAFSLDPRAFCYWGDQGWTLAPGEYRILVGSSSRDIRLRGTLQVP